MLAAQVQAWGAVQGRKPLLSSHLGTCNGLDFAFFVWLPSGMDSLEAWTVFVLFSMVSFELAQCLAYTEGTKSVFVEVMKGK